MRNIIDPPKRNDGRDGSAKVSANVDMSKSRQGFGFCDDDAFFVGREKEGIVYIESMTWTNANANNNNNNNNNTINFTTTVSLATTTYAVAMVIDPISSSEFSPSR